MKALLDEIHPGEILLEAGLSPESIDAFREQRLVR